MIFVNKIKLKIFIKKWRKKNNHNTTNPINIFFMDMVTVGKGTYGSLNILTYNTKSKLNIGNYCSIAQEVKFILSADHPLDTVSTFPFKVKCLGEKLEGVSKGDIIIEDDVWIGYRSTILSGISIGQGAVVAAGSVVTKDIPPYAVVGGVPARILKYRFSEEVIEKLIQINFGELDCYFIKNNINNFYVSVDRNIDLTWLPLKKTYMEASH